MKTKNLFKAVSMLLVFCVVLGMGVCLADITSVKAETALPGGAGLLQTFDSSDAVSKVSVGSTDDTEVKYDETVGAMSVKAKTANTVNSTTFYLSGLDKTVMSDEYPVIAMRVKLADASMATADNGIARLGYFIGSDGTKGSRVCSAYEATTEWQTVYIDFSNYQIAGYVDNHPYFNDSEKGMGYAALEFYLYNYAKTDTAADTTFYVQWVGAFDSVESVFNYSGMTYSRVIEFDESFNIASGTANVGAEGKVALTAVNSAVEYDEAEGALKITPNVASKDRGIKLDLSKLSISATEYPVMVYRLKFSDPDTGIIRYYYHTSTTAYTYALAAGSTVAGDMYPDGSTNATMNSDSWGYLLEDDTTGDWQDFTVDFTDGDTVGGHIKNNSKYWSDSECEGYWNIMQITVPNYRVAAFDIPYYIDYVGFYSKSTANEPNEFTGAGVAQRFDSDTTVSKVTAGTNTDVEYSAAENALKVSAKTANTADAATISLKGLDGSVKSNEYPVIAMRVRLANTSMASGENSVAKIGYTLGNVSGSITCGNYKATTDWQTIYVDMANFYMTLNTANHKYFMNEADALGYTSIDIQLYDSAKADTPTSAKFYVKWIGAFDSVESVFKSSGQEYSRIVDFDEALAFDANGKAAVGPENLATVAALNSTIEYDSTENAIKVTPTNLTQSVERGVSLDVSKLGISSHEYPVVVYRYRFAEEDTGAYIRYHYAGSTSTSAYASTMVARGEMAADDDMAPQSVNNNAIIAGDSWLIYWEEDTTTEWEVNQVSFITAANNAPLSGIGVNRKYWDKDVSDYDSAWGTFQLYMPNRRTTGEAYDTPYYIDYIGFYASAQEAASDVANIVNFEKEDNVKRATSEGNATLTYDETEQAMKVTTKTAGAANAGRFNVSLAGKGLNSAEYPILAIKVKTSDISKFMNSVPCLWNLTQKINEDVNAGTLAGRVSGAGCKYKNTDDYQVIYTDFSASSFNRCDYFKEGDLASDWLSMAFTPFVWNYADSTTDDYYYVKWMGLFESKEALDEYAGLTRSEGALFYDFSDENNMGEMYNTGYDSDISYDATENAVKVVVADKNGDGAFNTNAGGFSLGYMANNETENICPTEDYPVIAIRVKTSSTEATPGWFYFQTEGNTSEYPISRPVYQKTTEWQTIAINCAEESIMADYFKGNWIGMTFCLGLNGMSEAGDTYWVQWVATFKTVEEAYAYTGEKPPVITDDDDTIVEDGVFDTEEEEPAVTPVVKDEPVVTPEVLPETEEDTDDGELTIDDLIRIKSAAASVVAIEDGKIVVNQIMTAARLKSAFSVADGYELVVANPEGLLLYDETSVQNGYSLIIRKDGAEVMKLSITAPEQTATDNSGLAVWQIVLICVGGFIILAGIGFAIFFMIRKGVFQRKNKPV